MARRKRNFRYILETIVYTKFIPDKIKYVLIAFFSFAIGVANWDKDFAIHRIVILPFIYTDFYIFGALWYTLGFLLELFSIVAIILLGKNKFKTAILGLLYESGSVINFYLFLGAFSSFLSKFIYEITWNTIFFFFQVPIFVIMLLLAFGAID